MTSADLPRVDEIAAAVHPAFPEDAAVFSERLALYPDGCHVLERKGVIEGYVLGHPWDDGEPPALNSLLRALPSMPSTFYIHDLALMPAARGIGAADGIVVMLIEQARRSSLRSVSLVAVNGSAPFWHRHGCQPAHDETIAAKLRSYGAEARFMRLTLSPT